MNQGMNFSIWHIVIFLIYVVVIILPFWKITTKAGYPGLMSLLMVIPLVNLVYLYFLAFSNWPSLNRSGRG